MDNLLARIFGHQGAHALVVTALLLLLAEIGYRFGRRLLAGRDDDPRRSQIGVIQGAALGMLGLLLGFTLSMAIERYNHRRELVLQEANDIWTTWLRASLLPDSHPPAVRDFLRDYVDVRLRAQEALRDPAVMTEGLRRSAQIQSALWQHAEASAREAPNDITATFVEAVNALIDTDEERLTEARHRIPAGVWIILLVVAGVGCYTSGYGSGSEGVRSAFTGALLPLLIAIVIVLIFDLTNERHGMIRTNQQPLIDLQNAIRSELATREQPLAR
jgi:hypothetical protein